MGCTVSLHIWMFLFSGASSPEGGDPMLGWLQVPFSAPYRAAIQLLPLRATVWLSGWHSPPQYTPLPCLPSQRSAHPLSHIVSFIVVFFSFPNVSTFLFSNGLCELPLLSRLSCLCKLSFEASANILWLWFVQEGRKRFPTLFSWHTVLMCWHLYMPHSAFAHWLLTHSLLTGFSGYCGYHLSPFSLSFGFVVKPFWQANISLIIWTVILGSFHDMDSRFGPNLSIIMYVIQVSCQWHVKDEEI